MAEATAPTCIPSIAFEVLEDFLTHYKPSTRALYASDMSIYFDWCIERGMDPLAAKRRDLEAFIKHMIEDRKNSARSAVRRFTTVRGFYKIAMADDVIDKDPLHMVRLPRWQADVVEAPWLNREQVAALLKVAEARTPAHFVLVSLLATLGLRVSEACGIQIEDIRRDDAGYTTVTVLRKGGAIREMPIPIPVLRAVERARGGRESGPLILTAAGRQQTRNGAYFWMKELARKAGLPSETSPHSLRHAAITAFVRSGATIFEAQRFADHADIRTTRIYYHETVHHDQHGSHAVARYYASA